jgi:uncharacterized protein (DUF1778 family)
MTATAKRTEKLDLRLTPEDKRALQEAAAADRRSVSDFVLVSALARARELAADRTVFKLNGAEWNAFQEALNAPYEPSPRLTELLRSPGVLERSGD